MMKKLAELAAQRHLSHPAPDDPEWEPYLGSEFLRARHEYSKLKATLPAKTKAWEKMGILFGYVEISLHFAKVPLIVIWLSCPHDMTLRCWRRPSEMQRNQTCYGFPQKMQL